MMAPLWSSGFRPFFLLGAAYGPLIVLMSTPAGGGLFGTAASPLWHGHEMLFGFAAAFICGFVLTALPSWAGTPAIKGRPLQLLAALWIAGRAAAWLGSPAWIAVAATADVLLFAMLASLVLPGLVRVVDRRYLALLPILFCLLFADARFHAALWHGDIAAAQRALRMAVDVLSVLFAIVGGLLTPIFTETALRESGRRPLDLRRSRALEAAAVASVILFAAGDWAAAPAAVNGIIASLAAAIHLLRLARWRSGAVLAMPMILAMHVAYAWFAVAMALRAGADLSGSSVAGSAWIHAFTVGALSMMMLALLNRVALRHTGRASALSPLAMAGLAIMFAAAVVRVGAGVFGGGAAWIAASAWLWAIAFVLFLCTDGAKLWRPSLPRRQADETAMFRE